MKPRQPPLLLDSLSAAVRRIVPDHPKKQILKSRLAAVRAGYAGELITDRVFERYQFHFEHAIFHDLSLHSSSGFQIDTLFITPSHAVIIEVKNIAGSISLKSNPPQLIRTLENGQSSGFESPVSQVQRKEELLQDWLAQRNIQLPIYSIVVLAYPKNPVSIDQSEIQFLYPSGIPSYLRNLPTSLSSIRSQQFVLLSDELLRSHLDFVPRPICDTYSLMPADFVSGVFCDICEKPTMIKYRMEWRCSICGEKSAIAHRQALREWFLLFGGSMKNRQCREFLRLPNRHVAYRILKKMDFEKQGASKNRRYFEV